MSHNKVFSRVPLGCCINLHCTNAPVSPFQSSQIVAHLKQVDAQREISIRYKKKNNTERRAEILFFSFISLFLVLIYHESIYLKQTGPMSKPNS